MINLMIYLGIKKTCRLVDFRQFLLLLRHHFFMFSAKTKTEKWKKPATQIVLPLSSRDFMFPWSTVCFSCVFVFERFLQDNFNIEEQFQLIWFYPVDFMQCLQFYGDLTPTRMAFRPPFPFRFSSFVLLPFSCLYTKLKLFYIFEITTIILLTTIIVQTEYYFSKIAVFQMCRLL